MKTHTAAEAAKMLGTTKLLLLASLRNAGMTTKFNRPTESAINDGHLVIPDSAANYNPISKVFISPLFTPAGIESIRANVELKSSKQKPRGLEKRCACCGNGRPIIKLKKIGADLICNTCITEQESMNILSNALLKPCAIATR